MQGVLLQDFDSIETAMEIADKSGTTEQQVL